MKTIKITISDNIYNHIISILKNINPKYIKISEENDRKINKIDFSKYNIDSFKDIKNPVEWQRELRNEWD